MKCPPLSVRSVPALLLSLVFLLVGVVGAFATGGLQGQNKGATNVWVSENAMGWQELDYIPCRVAFGTGSAGTQSVEIDFPFNSGGTPGFENLFFFTCATTNASFVSGPTLTTSPTGNWAYNFTVNISDNNPAYVTFFARLAAGASANTGSSLKLTGSAGLLQVHKPALGAGLPDLAIVKTGPAIIPQGATITYTLTYTNVATGTNTAFGTQATDILPADVLVDPATLPANAQLVGTNGVFYIFWDLTNVAPGIRGQFTFQGHVPFSTPVGSVLTNTAQILCSQPDANPANNVSTWLTTVTNGCTGVVVSPPLVNQTVCPGSTTTFVVGASGTGLTYQWYFGSSLLSGQTASALNLTNVTTANVGTYSVVISDACGDSVTNSATLALNDVTSVLMPPTDQTVCPGGTANFAVNATGTDLTYQWYFSGSPMMSQTSNTLSLTNVTAANAGIYSVVTMGACGNPVTNSANLTVNADTFVPMGPSDQTVCPGGTANFAVNATGTDLTYQWYYGGSPMMDQTSNTLSLTNVTAANAGLYSVVTMGACGIPVTNSATLTVNANAFVPMGPSDQTVCPGGTANFAVNATGTDLTYQWYYGGSPMMSQTSNTLSLTNVTAANAGIYSVVTMGACGIPVTNSATLTVNANTFVPMGPSDQTVCPGGTANFAVNATGTDLTYQWYYGGSPMMSQTSNTLSLTNVTAANAGLYCVVTMGACGIPVTNSATLTVNANTFVPMGPSDQTVCPGGTANFAVNATGTDLTYQWYYGGSPMVSQTSNTLSLTNVTAANAGIYSVVTMGACGIPVTNSATLTVNANTFVPMGPSDQTVCPGGTANFAVNATGTDLTYQWYYGGSPMMSQTSNTLSLTNVTAANAGLYSVVTMGACGIPVTNSATLTVNANTFVPMGPSDQTVCPGGTANFAVNATGTDLTYQWYYGGSPMMSQTSNTLSLTNVTAANAGLYSVVTMGACGNPVTNSATLTVNANTFVPMGPSDQTVCPGGTANFAVNATGTDLTYQWYYSGSPMMSQTSNTLSLTNVTAANAGLYSVVTVGACGIPVTNSATLTVNANTFVPMGPSDQTVCPGGTANFAVNATGTDLTYQWYYGGSPMMDQTSNTLSLTNVTAANAGLYSVVTMGACGIPVTNSATLTVNANTFVPMGPSDQTVCPGGTANFAVNATGTDLTYQWYFSGSPLMSQTSNTLSLTNVTAANAGLYSVVTMGACGNPVTNSATLTVNANTFVPMGPSDQTVCPGGMANFAVNATGTDLTYQWYYGGSPMMSQTSNTLSLTNVTAANAGLYSVVTMGACGNPVTNSATLTVNADTFVTMPPVSSTNCPGTTAYFSVNATGTGLAYQWYQGSSNLLLGQTSSTLTLSNLTAAKAGPYSVVTMGACGIPKTNSAVLIVNQNVSVAPLPNVTNLLGSSVTFTAMASGTGPFSYQWFQGANELTGQTNSTLTLNDLQPGNGGAYSVSVIGECGAAATSAFVLTIHLPPVVTITYPTNGQMFVAPATFDVMASANDPDGIITNVQFFYSTNGTDSVFLGETNNAPYLTVASNLAAGSYTFTAQAADNFGATAWSAPVTVDVVPAQAPTVTVIGHMTLNLQDGYQWLSNVVCNPVDSYDQAVRVYVHNITNSTIQVVNATGTNNGLPYIESPAAIQPGTCWTNVIMFYDPYGALFSPTLTVELVPPPNAAGNPTGTTVPMLQPRMLPNGTFLIEFASVSGSTYYVQYSSDMVNWNTSLPAITGTGQHMQWIDSGPPLTASLPAANVQRFYRVILAQ